MQSPSRAVSFGVAITTPPPKEHGVHVLPSVSARIVVAEAALSGQAVREVEPDGPSAREFAALTDAVEALLPHGGS